MPWAGGNYTKGNSATGGWTGDASLGIGIEAGRHDTQDNDFATGIDSCLAKNGSNSCTGNLNFGGFKPTNVAAGTAAAPAYCAGGDVNTGMYSAAADTIGWATNGAEKMRLTSSGQLAVGVTSASAPLHIEGSGIFGSQATASNYSLSLYSGTSGRTSFTRYSGANGVAEIRHQGTGTYQVVLEDAANFRVDTNSVQRFLVDSAGQVEVGDGTASAPGLAFISDTNTGFYRVGADTLGITTSGVEAARVSATGTVGINDTTTTSYRLRVRASSSTGLVGAARLATDYSGDVGNPVLLIEKYDATNTTSQIFVRFNIGLGSTPAGSGQITANGANQAAFGSYSDRRMKENITPLGDELSNILALNPVEFDYINGAGHQLGFIAQEVQEIYPDLISSDENGNLLLADLNKNDARLIKAFQQLAAKIEALEARIAELEA